MIKVRLYLNRAEFHSFEIVSKWNISLSLFLMKVDRGIEVGRFLLDLAKKLPIYIATNKVERKSAYVDLVVQLYHRGGVLESKRWSVK